MLVRPVALVISAEVRSTSERASSSDSRFMSRWSQVWLATTIPLRTIRATRSGWTRTFWPRTKKVAVTPSATRLSSSRPVSGPGPSSKVSATHLTDAQSTAGPGDCALPAGALVGAGPAEVGAADVGTAEVGTDTAYGKPEATACATRRPRSESTGVTVADGRVTLRLPDE